MPGTDPITPDSRRCSVSLPRPLWIAVTALILIVVAALLSALMPAYRHRAAIRELEAVGGKVRIRPGGPDWLRRSIGNERMAIFDQAEFVSLYASSINDDQIGLLAGFPKLPKLVLLGTPTGDRGMRHIGRILGLQYLDLEGTKVTDDGLASLAGLTHLVSLDLSRTDVSDEGLLHLKSLKYLKQLRLYETHVTDEGVATLKRALAGLEVLTSPHADFEHVFDEPSLESLFEVHPWHSWKFVLGGRPRVIRFDGARLFMIPGTSRGAVHLFDESGTELANWKFSTGWRINLVGASFEPMPELMAHVLIVQTQRSINGRNVAKQFFAFSGDRLRFIRMEDEAGQILQNNYYAPNHTLGVEPEVKQLEEWMELLKSPSNIDVLAALTFIGGRHMDPPDASPGWQHEDVEQAKLALLLQNDPGIQELVGRLQRHENVWIREAADVATAEMPRVRSR